MRHPVKPPANPGAAATATLFDTGPTTAQNVQAALSAQKLARVRVAAFVDQNATFIVSWYAPGSSNARIINGTATPPAGETITANVPFERSVLLYPGRTKITIVTVTGPTVWEIGIDTVDDQALEQ